VRLPRLVVAGVWLLVAGHAPAAGPEVTYLFPAGARIGTTVDVTVGGKFPTWPVQVWSSVTEVVARAGPMKGTLRLTVAAGARPGTCWLRLFDAEGASRLCPFVLGTLPEVLEQEPNDDPSKPQRLDGPALVVNGRLATNGDVDHFALSLRRGQTLVASAQANGTLGSPMDGVLQILSATGVMLAENNDWHGLDPQIAFSVPADGSYLVRLFAFPAAPDSSIRLSGGPAYVYRLTLTTEGFADHAFPPAVSLRDPAAIRLAGWNLPDAARQIALRPQELSEAWSCSVLGVANPATVRVEPHPVVVEREPHDATRPQLLVPPVTVAGHIDPPGDVDVYRFTARKGQTFLFQLEAAKLGSPLDAVLKLTDAAGKLLQETEETAATDPALTFTAPADGSYQIGVRDLLDAGGWRYVYRLRVVFPEPDYALTVPAEIIDGTTGSTLEVPVTIVRQHGFARPIQLSVEGLPAGAKVIAPLLDGSATKGVLKIEMAAAPFSGPVRIVGLVQGKGTRIARAASTKFGLESELLWLTVRPAKRT
jgi:hypothetical protein